MRANKPKFPCTDSEVLCKRELIKDGWEVFRGGWPDFLALKEGKLRFIECKRNGPLSPWQEALLNALKSGGCIVEMVYENRRDAEAHVRSIIAHEELLDILKRNHRPWMGSEHKVDVCSTCKAIAKAEGR